MSTNQASQSYETLLVTVSDHVAEIVINRPDKLNALSAKVFDDLRQILTILIALDDVRAIIVTGSGEKAFVAGADISELAALNDRENGREFAEKGQDVFNMIESSTKPFIAAINGFALGGGCELALACHIRICAEPAKFGQPEVNLGIIPGYGGTQRLTRVVGRTLAADLILTGRMINASEAFAQGLVSRVVPASELLTTARAIGVQIAEKAPLAIQAALECVFAGIDETLEEGLDREAGHFGSLTTTADFHEGTTAFLEKRKPLFLGK